MAVDSEQGSGTGGAPSAGPAMADPGSITRPEGSDPAHHKLIVAAVAAAIIGGLLAYVRRG